MSKEQQVRKSKLISDLSSLIAETKGKMVRLSLSEDRNYGQNYGSVKQLNDVIRSIENNERQKQKYLQIQRLISYNNSVRQRKDLQNNRLIGSKNVDLLNNMYEEKLDNYYKQETIKIYDQTGAQQKQIQFMQMILIQSYHDWKELNNKVSQTIDQVKKKNNEKKGGFNFIKCCFSNQNKKQISADLKKKVDELIESSFFLIQYWKYKDISHRIICINKEPNIDNSSFYIYHKENDPQLLQNLDQQSAATLKQKLVATHFAAKEANNIDIISKVYMQKTKDKLAQQLIFCNYEQNVSLVSSKKVSQSDSQPVAMKTQSKIQKEYPKEAIIDFVGKWREGAQKFSKQIKTYLLIQPKQLYIPKSQIKKEVYLTINKQKKQSFVYMGESENYKNYFAFQPINKQTYSYDKKDMQTQQIKFKVQAEDIQKKKNILANNIIIPFTQNQSLGFSHELELIPVDNANNQNQPTGSSYILLFRVLVACMNNSQIPQNLQLYRKQNLFAKLGKIPNIYSSYYTYDYTPEIHPQVSQMLTGKRTQVTSKNFKDTYMQFVNYFEKEDNNSQSYCESLKNKGYKEKQFSGFVMKDRYKMYCQYLNKFIEQAKLRGGERFKNSQTEVSKDLKKRHIANLKDDLNEIQLPNKSNIWAVLKRFIIDQYLSAKNGKNNKQTNYNASMIKIADRVIQIYNWRLNGQPGNANIGELSAFFIGFMEALYPYYHNLNTIRQDLTHIRLIAQKYIPQFNYSLNRKGIGLENYASSHLLQLFTSLPVELCYRIWDYMVSNIQGVSQNARLIPLYTIMLHQEKSNMIPIFPINQIIKSIHVNSSKIKFDISAFQSASKVIQNYSQKNKQRQQSIVQLAKEKYLRKFAFGKSAKQGNNNFDEDKYEANGVGEIDRFQNNNSMIQVMPEPKQPILKITSYPLPTPGYGGYYIEKVYLFIGGVFLLGNLNLRNKVYKLQINLSGGSQLKEVPISDKCCFINKFVDFDLFKEKTIKKIGFYVEFRLIEQSNAQIMSARLKLDGYHKDVVYRQNINLSRSKNFNSESTNLVSSVTNIAIIIKSNNNKIKQRENWQQINRKQIQVYEKILDYDLQSSNNELIKSMLKLDKLMNKIIDPLDQLNQQKYLNLKIATAFRNRQPQWIHHSKLSIEELKNNFSSIFCREHQKSIQLNVFKFYSNYAENYQEFQLGQFLVDLILMAPITKLKKLSMIFCICIHYQNIYQGGGTQKMSIQTLNSLIAYMLKSTGFINACPFTNKYFGKIMYAFYYDKASKTDENKKDITQIVQDWVYISQLNSNYSGIILGSVQNLSVLRAMLPSNILNTIEHQPQCRFQIHYEVQKQIYVWAATVNTADFNVIHRGVKFLNNYPKYLESQVHMSSVQQIMHNCQDMIPLQSHCPIDYQQFKGIFKQNPLFHYILSKNEYMTQVQNSKQKNQNQLQKITTQIQQFQGIQINGKKKQQEIYQQFAIYRHQNCIPSWKKCTIQKDDGNIQMTVKFKDKQGQFVIPRYEVISLNPQREEQDLIEKSNSGMEKHSH